MKINHISIATSFFEETLKIFKDLLNIEPEIINFDERKLKIGIFHLENLMLEIISPMEGEEIVSKFIEKRGGGIHHIAFEVENAEEKLKELENKGFKIAQSIRRGVKSKKVFFLDPKTTGKVLVEIVEKIGSNE